jgi:hypothetical protein
MQTHLKCLLPGLFVAAIVWTQAQFQQGEEYHAVKKNESLNRTPTHVAKPSFEIAASGGVAPHIARSAKLNPRLGQLSFRLQPSVNPIDRHQRSIMEIGSEPRSTRVAGRDDCAGTHGDYGATEWEDAAGECRVSMSFGDWSTSLSYMNDVGCEGGYCGPICQNIEEWLLYDAEVYEWTGWYDSGSYFWDARWDSPYDVGFHYDMIHDAGLWAHEGAHGYLSDSDEYWPDFYQYVCPYDPQNSPLTTTNR